MYDRVHYEAEPSTGRTRRLLVLAIVMTITSVLMWALMMALIQVAPALVLWLSQQLG